MGFFDLFKKKKQPSMPDTLSKIFKAYFPKGIEQQKLLTNQLCKKLGNRYKYEEVANNYIFVLTCLFADDDKSQKAIVNKVLNRLNNKLSLNDILIIYNHAVDNNEELSKMIGILNMIDNMCQDGTSEDTIPEGYGEFGRDITNPIPIHGIPENEVYLKKLRLYNGSKISWTRIGSCSSPNIKHLIDDYEIFDNNGEKICELYLCPYHKKTSNKAPKGFIFEGQRSQNISNQAQPLQGKILPAKRVSYVVDENGEPMMVYYREASKLFVNRPTSKDNVAYYLNIRHPLLIDVTGKERIDIPEIPSECDGVILVGYGIYKSTAFIVRDLHKQSMQIPLKEETSIFEPNATGNNNNDNEAYLLLFSASWCGPSKHFKKEIEAAGISCYSYIDVDDESNQDLSSKYNIRNIPTTVLLTTSGKEINRWVGYDDEDVGQSKFVRYINNCNYKIIQYKGESI